MYTPNVKLVVRCPGIHTRVSPRVLTMTVVVLALLAVVPAVAALRLWRSSTSWKLSLLPDIKKAGPAPSRRSVAPDEKVINACEELAQGVERLDAEITVVTFAPQSSGEVMNLHYLNEVTNSDWPSPETTGLATRGLTASNAFLHMDPGSDPQRADVRKLVLLSNWDALLRDLAVSIRKDCDAIKARGSS